MTKIKHTPNKRTPMIVEFRGEQKTINEIIELTGLKERAVYYRVEHGLPLEGKVRIGKEPKRLEFRGGLATQAEIVAATGYSRAQVSKRHDGVRYFEQNEPNPYEELHYNAVAVFYNGVTDSLSGWGSCFPSPPSLIFTEVISAFGQGM